MRDPTTNDELRAALADAVDTTLAIAKELRAALDAANAAIAARDKRLADIAALAAQRSASGGVNAARMRKIEAIAKGDTP